MVKFGEMDENAITAAEVTDTLPPVGQVAVTEDVDEANSQAADVPLVTVSKYVPLAKIDQGDPSVSEKLLPESWKMATRFPMARGETVMVSGLALAA